MSNATKTHNRVSYLDCLKGNVQVPHTHIEKTLFTLLMVGGMVTFMVNFNGVYHSGLDFYPHGLWLIPVVFCIAAILKLHILNGLCEYLIRTLVVTRFTGFKKSLGISLCNVGVMAPTMGCIVTLLLNGTDGYFAYILHAIPVSATVAVIVNVFLVGPAIKMIYNNYFAVKGPAQTSHRIAKHVMNIAYMLND